MVWNIDRLANDSTLAIAIPDIIRLNNSHQNIRSPMKHRKLRIAWSVTWSIVAVLLMALWMRSYWRADSILWWAAPNGRISRITIFNSYIEFNNQVTGTGDDYEFRFSESYVAAPALFETRHYGFVWKRGILVIPSGYCARLQLAARSRQPSLGQRASHSARS